MGERWKVRRVRAESSKLNTDDRKDRAEGMGIGREAHLNFLKIDVSSRVSGGGQRAKGKKNRRSAQG